MATTSASPCAALSVFKPNLQKKTFVVDGQKITMTLSTKAIRILKKKGILGATADK